MKIAVYTGVENMARITWSLIRNDEPVLEVGSNIYNQPDKLNEIIKKAKTVIANRLKKEVI
jgi:hypothetical protein